MPIYSGLLVSCHRNLEQQTMSEIHYTLTEKIGFSKSGIKAKKTGVSGLIAVKLTDDVHLSEIMNQIIALEENESYFLYCLKIRPIQYAFTLSLESLKSWIEERRDYPKGDYRIEISKRHAKYSSGELISACAPSIPNKVNLDHPKWIFLIEIIADQIGISIIPPSHIFSSNRAFEIKDKDEENWFLD